jgi:hypothetical protein
MSRRISSGTSLATQAINRGMSLEAIAALLGHRSMSMTLTCARIADRTVAEEYFAVSQQVEALYDAEPALPAGAEGPNMRRLHTETTRRLLGNGYCTRPDSAAATRRSAKPAASSPPPSNSATSSKPSKLTRIATATPAARPPT